MSPPNPFAFVRERATRWDVIALVLVIGVVAFLDEASRGLMAPLTTIEAVPLSLDPSHLPQYAARTSCGCSSRWGCRSSSR